MNKTVTINNEEVGLNVFLVYADREITEELHSMREWESEQEFVDAYMKEYAKKHKEEFIIN